MSTEQGENTGARCRPARAGYAADYVKHNVNWKMKYRLTDSGRAIRDAYYRELGMEPPELVTDEDGYCTDQSWSVWQKYGSAMRLGGSPPFETEVLIEVKPEAA